VAVKHAVKQALPLAVQRTQLSLYLSTFREQLRKGGYVQEDSEIDEQIAAVKTMREHEISDVLASVKGVLTLETTVTSLKNMVLMGASLGSTLGPSVGLQLSGWDQHLARQQEELSAAATFIVLEDWDYYADSMSGKSRMAMMLCSSAMQCHNTNSIKMAHMRQQHASDELLRGLDG
jgi:hypothetical protein